LPVFYLAFTTSELRFAYFCVLVYFISSLLLLIPGGDALLCFDALKRRLMDFL